MRLRAASVLALLAAAASPAGAAPFLTPAFGLDSPVLAPSLTTIAPAAASDGTNTLVAWNDYLYPGALYAARVGPDGKVLDPVAIPLAPGTYGPANASVTFGGSTFLVTWEGEPFANAKRVYAARVTTSGTVMDPAGIEIAPDSFGDELAPSASFDGTNFVIAWGVALDSGGQLAAARLSPGGVVLDKKAITVSTNATVAVEGQLHPALAFDGTNTLVAWQDGRAGAGDIYANRVSPAGMVLDGNGFVVANSADAEAAPKLAFDGANTLAVWVDVAAGSSASSILGRRISPAGKLVDAGPLTISAATATGKGVPVVAFDGMRSLVAWTENRGTSPDLFASRVGTDGTVTDPQGLAVITAAGAQQAPTLAAAGGHFLLSWTDARVLGSTIYAARVADTGASADGTGFPLTSVPNQERTPAAASDGSRFFVVWGDSRPDGPGIRGVHVTPRGGIVETSSSLLSASTGSNTNPLVAWNGTEYLVVWLGTQHLLARRFSAAGVALDAADLPLGSMELLSSVASNGADFLVVGGDINDVQGTRVSGAGAVLDAQPFSICSQPGSRFNPRAIFDGTNYFVVWIDDRETQGHVYGARVSPAGVSLDPTGILLSPPTGVVADYQTDPDVAFDGTNSLVVWSDSRGPGIRGARVSPAGAVLDATGVTLVAGTTANIVGNPRVVFDGTSSVVTWEETTYDASFNVMSRSLGAARVSPAPALLDGFAIASHPKTELSVALASDRAGTTLLTWEFPTTLDNYPVSRAQARLLAETSPAGACTTAADCATGFCVDGLCCDGACGGGSLTDCLACSVAAGAAADGTCGPIHDGQPCDDANACTAGDHCAAGVCAPVSTRTCAAPDACHAPGTCSPATGVCSAPTPTSGACADAGVGDAGRDVGVDAPPSPDAGTTPDAAAPTDVSAQGAGGAGGQGTGGASAAAGSGARADGGDQDGSTGAAGHAPVGASSGCGCDLGGGAPGPAGLALLLGVLVARARARRRR